MINFAQDSLFKLHRVNDGDVNKDAVKMFTDGEALVGVYATVRDQVIFTTKRVITIDVAGITGKKKDFCSFPYKHIQFYAVQPAGFAELIPDSELMLVMANGTKVVFEFKGSNDILAIGRAISNYALD